MFGHKTVSWFDLWSIQHILFGLVLASRLREKFRMNQSQTLVATIAIAYSWELIEYLGEVGHFGDGVQLWMQGVEFWGNRLIADPLLAIGIGYTVTMKFPWLAYPASLASAWWWFFHLAVFPHCMYLQTAETWGHWYTWFFGMMYMIGFGVSVWLFRAERLAPRATIIDF